MTDGDSKTATWMQSPGFRVAWIVAGLAAGCSLAANIVLGDLNQDEGWYLYAAQLVSLGQLPYRDFAFTQAPMMPLVYSWIQPLVALWGVAAGRVFTAVLGFAGALIAAAFAARLAAWPAARRPAAMLAFILVLVNVYQTYYLAVVKTYALTALFLLAGFLALSVAFDRRSRLAAAMAGVFLVLATGTRTSAAIVGPLVLAWLFFDRKRLALHHWLFFGIGAALATGLLFLPFFIMAPDGAWFCMVQYHTLRTSGGVLQALLFKVGFISRLLQAYFVAVGLWLAVLLGQSWLRAEKAPPPAADAATTVLTRLAWAAVLALTLVHLAAPFPYEDYQVFVYPLFAAGVASMAVRLMERLNRNWMPWLLAVVFGLASCACISSPINQDWVIQGRDRIWWVTREQTPLRKLRKTAAMLRSLAQPGDQLLTQDPYLAVEAGLTLPHGLEMGQFSYFPDFDDQRAARLNVLNRAGMKRLLWTCDAPLAALSGYAFAMRAPEIEPLAPEEQAAFRDIVRERYELLGQVSHFGQAATTLQILRKKPAASENDRIINVRVLPGQARQP